MTDTEQLLLRVDSLETCFQVGDQTIRAVNRVSFDVYRGKTLGIVGESGCGKSVTVHSVMQLLPRLGKIAGGSVTYYRDGQPVVLSELKKNGSAMRAIRGREIGMIFQDPMSSLNPVYAVGPQIMENLLQHERMSKKEAHARVVAMMDSLGIPDPEARFFDYPHQFSGGMKQRAMIAVAMICNPTLLIADEPTTALDVTIQAQILELMKRLQAEDGKSIIIITHNMGIVAEMADSLAVMYMGRVVEFGTALQVFKTPLHPYTKALLRSVPVLGMGKGLRLESIRGSTPDPSELPEGCEFAPRCDFATEGCRTDPPDILLPDGHRVRCLNWKEASR